MKRLLLCTALLLAMPVAGSAHAFLRGAVPAVGSTVPTAPTELALRYTEGVVPAFTTVAVTNAACAHFEAARPHRGPDDPRQIEVPLEPMRPGTYTVIWHATSVDTCHPCRGSCDHAERRIRSPAFEAVE
jgi:methionine-rich copper-binding protein CopC